MKRWQDRGEVLDSDDEELSLGSESQSPSHARKRIRLDDDDDDDADILWATQDLYNRHPVQTKPAEHGQHHEPDDAPISNDAVQALYSSTPMVVSRGTTANLIETGVADTTDEKNEIEEETHVKHAVSSQPSQHSKDMILPQDAKALLSSQTGQSEDLPDIRDLLGHHTSRRRGLNLQQTAEESSGLSSPLSERELSPPAPSTFQLLRPGHGSSEHQISSTADDGQVNELANQTVLLDAQTEERAGGRSLRARNEKQLHPYLYDRAQHQKQFRTYGIRPIRVVPGQEANETQDIAANDDGNSSDRSWLEASPQHRPISPHRPTSAYHSEDSEDDLPEMSALLGRISASSILRGVKRRKLSHVRVVQSQTRDEFAIPPSPPSTSSNSASRVRSRVIGTGFRLPRGLTPEPLLTPQISSAVREWPARESAQGLGTGPSRLPTSARIEQAPVVIESSDESSQDQRQIEIDARRLRRERKRIKGVLPASWLKIDFRAQQKQLSPSPNRVRRLSSTSPPPTVPQRGVAQRVLSKRPISPSRQNAIRVSDDSADDGASDGQLSPRMRQLRLDFERKRATTAPSEFIDDERMEMDFIDPMLAGPSRVRSDRKQSRKRQPKITTSFAVQRDDDLYFSEERNAIRRAIGGAPRNAESTRERPIQRQRAKKRAKLMSIIDAPRSAVPQSEKLPQFVRVAMRRARKQHNHGRHSPSAKLIRLAVRSDTEDAMSVLHNWRGGTLMPGELAPEGRNPQVPSRQKDVEHQHTVRVPLTELPRNRLQKLLPPLRGQGNDRLSRHHMELTKVVKLRQTRLEPIIIQENDDHEDAHGSGDVEAVTPSNRSEKRHNERRFKMQARPIQYRSAQLESLEDDFSREHRAAVFESRIHRLTQGIARAYGGADSDFQLARFLRDPSSEPATVAPQRSNTETSGHNGAPVAANDAVQTLRLPHRPRKRLARRLDAEAREFRQPSVPLPESTEPTPLEQQQEILLDSVLVGLKPFGVRYATDFDVLPLPLGTYFHESSFIGSGDFAASLDFAGRDLDSPTGRIRIHLGGEILDWGVWTEDVATGLARIPTAVSDALNAIATEQDEETMQLVLSNVDYLLRSTARYVTRCLAFLDPVDRRACTQSLRRFIQDLFEVIAELDAQRQDTHGLYARCLQYTVVISRQFFCLCNHPLVPAGTKLASRQHLLTALNRLGSHIFPYGLQELRNIYEENQRAAKLEGGIRDTDSAMCSMVILHHVSRGLADPQTTVWTFLKSINSIDPSTLLSVTQLDKIWYDIFTVQPALEIDKQGILRPGSRICGIQDDWTLPKQLVQRLLELYGSTVSSGGSTMNDYVRATFTRCMILINRWGWWRCELLLGVISDFFARRNLVQLQNEENHGSPKFLSDLQHCPSLDTQPEDPSFHIFLKMLASGLQGMTKHGIYPDKKIGSIAWRFIPNHGRTYRKDAELRQEDLDALRNHHDLLCTLYYAAPATQRLRVQLIQDLVNHAVSHREVCRLNIRAWSTLVNFQSSTNEPIERLNPFNDWLRDMVTATVNQYRLVRSEVEQEVTAAIAHGKQGITSSVIEDTVARNQRQIAASLTDALVALKHALESSRSLEIALHLLESSSLPQVFNLFDPSARRLHGSLHEALNVVTTALDIRRKSQPENDSQQGNDESQDYGDSLALQELVCTQAGLFPNEVKMLDILQTPLTHLMSNVFGADMATDDTLLITLVDCWIRVALLSVQSGDRTWASYIHGYSSDAWSQLRDTEQRRRYSNYFLSRVVDLGDIDLRESGILTEWFKSLVEREALLKFQHKLTSAVLNRHPQERLLENLPFTPSSTGLYDISLHDLRQRRLALLSTVLSNMHNGFDETLRERPSNLQELRQTYAEMLRSLMQAMKQHYQELQSSAPADIADAQAHGAYVEFVQHVVTFLQQYSTDICPVDRFFTDSTVFPLPATDPTYVVGRLRSYVPKLGESRKRKELAVFIQTVSERAVVEGHQTYLVNQLVSSMAGDLERGSTKSPSLRHVLCTAIFPAYVEQTLSTACAWIVAVPILEACSGIVAKFLYKVIFETDASVETACAIIGTILRACLERVAAALTHHGRMHLPHVQRLLAAIFDFTTSCLTIVEFSDRRGGARSACGDMLSYFYELANYINVRINSSSIEAEEPDHSAIDVSFTCPWPDTREYVLKQVQQKFAQDWYASEGGYYVRRGANSVPVVVDLGDDEAERLHEAVGRFRASYEAIMLQRGGHEKGLVRKEDGVESVIV